MSDGLYIESGAVWASPELMPIEVCTQRKNGDVCIMTLNRRRLKPGLPSFFASCSNLACSRTEAMWLPTWRPCRKPP